LDAIGMTGESPSGYYEFLVCIAQPHQVYLITVFYRFMVPAIHSYIRELRDDLE